MLTQIGELDGQVKVRVGDDGEGLHRLVSWQAEWAIFASPYLGWKTQDIAALRIGTTQGAHTNHLLTGPAPVISARQSPLKMTTSGNSLDQRTCGSHLCPEMKSFHKSAFCLHSFGFQDILFLWALRLLAWGKKNMRTQNTISFKTICELWEMGDPRNFSNYLYLSARQWKMNYRADVLVHLIYLWLLCRCVSYMQLLSQC